MITKQPLQIDTQNPNQPLALEVKRNTPLRWKRIILFCSVSLGAAAVLMLHFLAPVVPGRAESFPARVASYLTQGQWRADSRTFAAVWDFCLRKETDSPPEVAAANRPVAATPTESTPRS